MAYNCELETQILAIAHRHPAESQSATILLRLWWGDHFVIRCNIGPAYLGRVAPMEVATIRHRGIVSPLVSVTPYGGLPLGRCQMRMSLLFIPLLLLHHPIASHAAAIHDAAMKGDVAAITAALDAGAGVDESDGKERRSILRSGGATSRRQNCS